MEHGGVIIGLDPHKSSNTIAVLERGETILLQRRFVKLRRGVRRDGLVGGRS
jgi:hypothetical protein